MTFCERYKHDMQFLWPEGLSVPGMHADTMRVYLMAYVAACLDTNNPIQAGLVMASMTYLQDPEWVIDDSWKWW